MFVVLNYSMAFLPIANERNLNVFAKLEFYNPTGSVKDRAAYNMISEAIKRKNIKKGETSMKSYIKIVV